MRQQNPVNLKPGFFDFLADKGVQASLRRGRTQQLQHHFGEGLEEVIKQEIRFHTRPWEVAFVRPSILRDEA